MFSEKEEYDRCYLKTKQLAMQSPGLTTVLIFVAASDVDALCALWIFTQLLTNDVIPHKIIPVQGFHDISVQNELLLDPDRSIDGVQIRSIWMLNCGGVVDLSEFLSLTPQLNVFLMDSHRPLSLDNIFHPQITILSDGAIEESREVREAFIELQRLEDDDEEGGDGDADEDDVGDEEDEELDNDGEEIDGGAEKYEQRLQRRLQRRERRARRRECETIIADYYSESSYGQSAASLAFNLAMELSRDNNDFLWMAIVGLADQFIFGKVDLDRYYEELDFFKEQVRRFNASDNAVQNGFEPKSMGPNDYRIVYNERDFRFLLFRHWSLHDSMLHSSYVAAKLGIWRERGKQKLHNLFAKMGFSAINAQQPYVDMPIELRKDIYEHLEDNAVQYGLNDLTFPSFIRYFGLKTVLSASDVVYCMTALMEAPPRVLREIGIGALYDGEGVSDKADRLLWSSAAEENNRGLNKQEDEVDFFGGFAGFYLAFDALYNMNLLLAGIPLAQQLHRAVVRTGSAIIDERAVKTLKTFRLIVLKDTPDLALFQYPLTLCKLAMFMVSAMRETGKGHLPLVLASMIPASTGDGDNDTYLIVGLPATTDGQQTNKFAQAFRKTADATRARVRQDRFDMSIIELAKPELAKFMEYLQIFL